MANILHIIESLSDFGGTPRKLLYLTESQQEHNHKNLFFCYLPSTLSNQFQELGSTVIQVNNKKHIGILVNIIKECKRHQIDIICTHFTRPLLLGVIAAKYLNIPIIHNEHSSTNYRKGIGMAISKIAMRLVDHIICNSNYTKSSVIKTYPYCINKCVTFYNPVKARHITKNIDVRKDLNIEPLNIVIGHIGGMIPSRDQLTLIQAFAKTISIHKNLHLIIIGDGVCKKEIKKTIAQENLTNHVSLIGYTNDIGNYLHELDIYINTTVDEGFGIAVAEAMLAQIPTIAADCGAHPEIISHNKTGLLYKKSSIEDLYEKIILLVNNKNLRKKLGVAGHESIRSKFTVEAYSDKFYSLITNILKRSDI